MAKPGQPFDKEEEQKIQAAIDAYQKEKRNKEINEEIERRIYEMEHGTPVKKKK